MGAKKHCKDKCCAQVPQRHGYAQPRLSLAGRHLPVLPMPQVTNHFNFPLLRDFFLPLSWGRQGSLRGWHSSIRKKPPSESDGILSSLRAALSLGSRSNEGASEPRLCLAAGGGNYLHKISGGTHTPHTHRHTQ